MIDEVKKKTTTRKTTPKTTTNKEVVKRYTFNEVVLRAMNGLYGFGEKRKKLIEMEGYNYNQVLKAINEKRGFK